MKKIFAEKQTLKNIAVHVSAWILLLLTLMLNTRDMSIETWMIKYNLPLWVFFLIIFYVNYLILIPRLMMKRKTVTFVLSSIILVAACYTLNKCYLQYIREIELKERLEHVINNSDEATSGKRREELIKRLNREIDRSFRIESFDPFMKQNQSLIYRMLLVYVVSLVMGLGKQWKHEEQRRKEIEKEHISSELDYLKAQINPHFLFNALNSIYSLTLSQPDNAGNAVLKLSSILRYMLYETDRKNVSLSEEMNVIENYLGLQKLRLTDKTRLSFERTGVADHYRIAPLLLVPLIENAFKYGVDSSEESFIDINITIEEGRLSMTIRNKIVRQGINKIVGGKSGSRQETKSEGQGYRQGGIGIKNIRRRLELLYPSNHTLKAEEQNGEFFVYLSLPLGKEIKTVQE